MADSGAALDLTREEAKQLVLHDELKGDELLERIDWPVLDAAHAKLRAFLAGAPPEPTDRRLTVNPAGSPTVIDTTPRGAPPEDDG